MSSKGYKESVLCLFKTLSWFWYGVKQLGSQGLKTSFDLFGKNLKIFDKILINSLLRWRFSNAFLFALLDQVVGSYDFSVYIRTSALDLE